MLDLSNKHLLPYQFYRTQVTNGHPDVLFHWHQELEIQYVYEGSAQYHIDYDYFLSQAGDIILIRPNGMHSIHPLPQTSHVTDTFAFDLDMVGASYVDQVSLHYLQPLQNSQYKFLSCIKPDMAGYQDLKDCLWQIFQLAREEGRHFELLLKSKLQEFLYLLFFHRYVIRKQSKDSYRKNEQLRDLIDYINQHYASALSIGQLAEQMGYSKTHFMAIFKEQVGISCTDFIIQVRLNKASQLLLHSSESILNIAQQVGFNNLSNFNRQFKNYYHCTPRQYRQEQAIKKD
ncbi:helix-turn-helix transcriptional regulator [Streptococcus cuniculipharyngis]|uniref:Helix-turn-helix domain-containing protein n=1 Tax=Streptococcus cuniculipharyngis TaxID=1562651 RepID=A0A5C5SFR8_9STRE|nr:AraC family transcriptional regulator [Streptococcus cuniculipharyngis]TWS98983.1 helix-turn-helix domain-containing protein [Streptococcus cuniculipharyngis]